MNKSRMKSELKKTLNFLADLIITTLVIGLVFNFAFQFGFIGSLAEGNIQTAIYTIFMMLFLLGFEEYSVIVFNKEEMIITFILSSIYSFICSAFVGGIVFRSLKLIGVLAIAFVIHLIVILLWNIIISSIDQKYGKKKKLLIIEDIKDDDDNERLRRMKYSCLTSFDSWYEEFDTDDMELIKKYAEEIIPNYDGVCFLENISNESMNIMINAVNKYGKDLYIVPTMSNMNYSDINIARFDDVMVFYMPPYGMSFAQRIIKRTMDLAFGVFGFLVAMIPMAIIALAIKLTSPGPVFYSQERLTRNKRIFNIYKFRTMVPDAEKLSGPVFSMKDDPRITKIGKILRKTRLDELPQIINILKGDMSIVGPRPERPFFVEQFEKEISHYNQRFGVKAGLTSLSHVYGRYSTYITDRTRYDLLYIRNYSLILDIKIILQTTRTMFLKDAAEGADSDGKPILKKEVGSDV